MRPTLKLADAAALGRRARAIARLPSQVERAAAIKNLVCAYVEVAVPYVTRRSGDSRLFQNPCPHCGDEVLWVVLRSGARVPVNPRTQRRVVLADEPHAFLADAYRLHRETCPKWPEVDHAHWTDD